jgi:hypothetical protein
MVHYERRKFCDAYNLAHSIWLYIVETPEPELIDHFDPTDARFCTSLEKPYRWTLLHYYIDIWYREFIKGFEEQYNDMLDIVVTEYEAVLNSYEIPHTTFELPNELDENYDLEANKILIYLRSLLPIKRIVNDTFQLRQKTMYQML